MFTLLTVIPLIYILTFQSVKMFIPDWSSPDRGFAVFDKIWHKIFAIAGASGTILAVALHEFAYVSIVTALVIGVTAGLLGVAAYTDGNVGKVPAEISSITVMISFVLGIGALLINSLNFSGKFYTNIYLYTPGDSWLWVAGGIGVGFIGFLGWLRISGTPGLIAILISALGFWVSTYVGLRTLSLYLGNTFGNIEFWSAFLAYGLSGVLAFILFTMAFELGAGNKMGGADSQSLYAAGWGFGAIVGPAYLAVGLIAAAVLQLVIHLLAKFIDMGGYYKDIPNSKAKQVFVNRKWEKDNMVGVAPTTHKALALPFLPVMNMCVITVTVAVVTGGLTIY